MKCQVIQLGRAGSRPRSCLTSRIEFPCSQLSVSSSWLGSIRAVAIQPVTWCRHKTPIAHFYRSGVWWGTPSSFILEFSPYVYSSVGFYWKLESVLSPEKKTTFFSQSGKDVEMVSVTCCHLIPLGIKCDCSLGYLILPWQRVLGSQGECPVRTYLWLTAIFLSSSAPTKPYPCAPTSSDSLHPDPPSSPSHPSLPAFLRLSVDKFFSCPFSPSPCLSFLASLKEMKAHFFWGLNSGEVPLWEEKLAL